MGLRFCAVLCQSLVWCTPCDRSSKSNQSIVDFTPDWVNYANKKRCPRWLAKSFSILESTAWIYDTTDIRSTVWLAILYPSSCCGCHKIYHTMKVSSLVGGYGTGKWFIIYQSNLYLSSIKMFLSWTSQRLMAYKSVENSYGDRNEQTRTHCNQLVAFHKKPRDKIGLKPRLSEWFHNRCQFRRVTTERL